MDKQTMALGLALVVSALVIWLVMYLTRHPVVVLEEVKERSAPRVLSQYIKSAIKAGLSERQMSRQEILRGSHWSPEETAIILDQMVISGDVSPSDATSNPRYTLVHRSGIDVV